MLCQELRVTKLACKGKAALTDATAPAAVIYKSECCASRHATGNVHGAAEVSC